jgi:hypothetical protein
MTKIEDLEEEINKIKQRNTRVEKDKKWETSWIRRILIAFGTYILILLFMFTIGADKPFLSALIPSIAFLLSTASLEVVKKWWLRSN